MTYLITWVCYGSHLHGDESGSVDRKHNLPGSRLMEADAKRVSTERKLMDQPPYEMNKTRRQVVLAALVDRCSDRQWGLLAAHVRTNHIHIVVEAKTQPERVMNDLKSYASRYLNRLRLDDPGRKRWARHGSTRWLWNPQSILAAIKYVVEDQGEAMAVFPAD